MGNGCANTPAYPPFVVYINRLPGFEIPHQFETEHIQRNAFRSEHVLQPVPRISGAVNQRPDSIGIPDGQNSAADDHGHNGKRTPAASEDAFHRQEYVVRT